MPIDPQKTKDDIKPGMAGVYIISTVYEKDNYKIGRSVDVYKRLNSYHNCFNKGFLIHEVLIVNPKNYAKKNKTQKEKDIILQKTKDLENYIHKDLEHSMLLYDTRVRKSEWFQIKEYDYWPPYWQKTGDKDYPYKKLKQSQSKIKNKNKKSPGFQKYIEELKDKLKEVVFVDLKRDYEKKKK